MAGHPYWQEHDPGPLLTGLLLAFLGFIVVAFYEELLARVPQFRQRLEWFLSEIVPVAEESGVKLAIHPDDPPWSIFGLPRIITDGRALERLVGKRHQPDFQPAQFVDLRQFRPRANLDRNAVPLYRSAANRREPHTGVGTEAPKH